nr:hypothetical protein [uncultured Mediterranean phage uvMED]
MVEYDQEIEDDSRCGCFNNNNSNNRRLTCHTDQEHTDLKEVDHQ